LICVPIWTLSLAIAINILLNINALIQGNDNLYRLTSYGTFRLRIELKDFKGQKRFAEYEHFRIGSETDKYKISFTGYYGDAG